MKYSIILPYYDRIQQLKNTLDSFIKFYNTRDDYEVILVLDQKQTESMNNQLNYLLWDYLGRITIKVIYSSAKISFSPSTAFNDGVHVSSGVYIILSNPECLHETDILKESDKIFEENKNVYIICGCKSLNQKGEMDRWYQHTKYRDECYHFCSCISKENYENVGGFNEAYTTGYGYDDNSFRDRVKAEGLEFCKCDDMIVSHQWHDQIRPAAYRQLLQQNKEIYQKEFKELMGV